MGYIQLNRELRIDLYENGKSRTTEIIEFQNFNYVFVFASIYLLLKDRPETWISGHHRNFCVLTNWIDCLKHCVILVNGFEEYIDL